MALTESPNLKTTNEQPAHVGAHVRAFTFLPAANMLSKPSDRLMRAMLGTKPLLQWRSDFVSTPEFVLDEPLAFRMLRGFRNTSLISKG